VILTLEDILQREADSGRQFAEDVADALATEAGARVMKTLVELAHPFRSPMRDTERETLIAIGRKEVVTLLWERVQAAGGSFNPHKVPAQSQPPKTP
jgi:hypothetical protein